MTVTLTHCTCNLVTIKKQGQIEPSCQYLLAKAVSGPRTKYVAKSRDKNKQPCQQKQALKKGPYPAAPLPHYKENITYIIQMW